MYATVLLLTCSVTLIVKTTESMLPFKMCFPLINPTNSVNILYKIGWLISISQLLCLFIICVQNTLLLYCFQHSKQTVKRSISDVSLKRSLVITLATSTGTVAVCWLPTSAVYIATLILPSYPVYLIYWTITVVVPLTSLVSPTASIIMNLKKLMDVKRPGCEGASVLK